MALQVRGMALATTRAYAKEAFEKSGWEGLIAELPAADAKVWETLILPTGWYPIELFHNFLRALDRRNRARVPDLGHQLGRRIARGNIKFFLSLVVPLLSPLTVLSQASPLWKEYFSAGAMHVVDEGHHAVKITLDNPGVDRIVCGEIVVGWGVQAVEETRAKVVRAEQVHCVHEGFSRCEYVVTWR
ncbi:MAG TPA: hypothetical protein VFF06_10265 [Polyangia bacterium]|nr:hypothetical protein [Polyangia bacterium]